LHGRMGEERSRHRARGGGGIDPGMARLGGRAINPGMESGRRFLCVLVHVWRRSEGKLGENRGDEDLGVGWALELPCRLDFSGPSFAEHKASSR
jgi:hypothetical protein